MAHVGAPVTVRLHADRVVIWRDTVQLATHQRAPDGARRRVIDPEHYTDLFASKPRAQVMLYRQRLIELDPIAAQYLAEVSRRHRTRLRQEVLAIDTLYQAHGATALVGAMRLASLANRYDAASLAQRLTQPSPRIEPTLGSASPAVTLVVPVDLPPQIAVDRPLGWYETFVLGRALADTTTTTTTANVASTADQFEVQRSREPSLAGRTAAVGGS